MRNNNSLGSDSKLSLFDSLFPIIVLVILLFINVNIYGDASLDGSNQFILIIGAAIAYLFGQNKVSSSTIFSSISSNIKSISIPILILLLVGALSGTWLLSGIIPSMNFIIRLI